MKHSAVVYLLCCLAAAATAVPAPLLAQVTAAQVAPAQRNVAMTRNVSFNLRWSVTTDAGPFVSSQQATLEDASGNVYLTVPRQLSVNASVPLDTTGAPIPLTVALPERMTIPAAALARAVEAGVNRLFYRRVFVDGSMVSTAPIAASVVLDITGSGAAGFALNYVGLRFDDGSVRRMVHPDASLRVRATLRFTGNGPLRAVWELADPSSSAGTPVFRPLRVVRKPLFGGQAVYLDSPPLPTRSEGLYRVRLRVIEPALSQTPGALQYFVSEGTGRELAAVELLTPADAQTLNADTTFQWRAVTGATAYRLEFYPYGETGSGLPLAGMEVDGARQQLVLSPLMQRHLHPGGVYRWRLVALDASGQRIGQSEWRTIRRSTRGTNLEGG